MLKHISPPFTPVQHVFSVHRMAIRRAVHQSPRSNLASHRFSSNSSLMKTVDSLMKMSLVMNADRSAEWVLRSIIDEAKMLVGAEVASVFLVDEANQELYSTINSTAGEIRIPLTHGIAGHVATTGEVVNIQDAYQDERFNQVGRWGLKRAEECAGWGSGETVNLARALPLR